MPAQAIPASHAFGEADWQQSICTWHVQSGTVEKTIPESIPTRTSGVYSVRGDMSFASFVIFPDTTSRLLENHIIALRIPRNTCKAKVLIALEEMGYSHVHCTKVTLVGAAKKIP